MSFKVYLTVLNPRGVVVEIDEARWLELSKKGYKKVGNTYTEPQKVIDGEFLEVEEI